MRDVIDSCSGDVRHAISALQYLCVAQTAAAAAEGALDSRAFDGKGKGAGAASKRKRKKKGVGDPDGASGAAAAPSSHRDDNFSVFHSVGKILYAKSTELREVASIVEAADVGPLAFLEWIHTNYVDHLVPPFLPVQHASSGAAAAALHRLPSSSQRGSKSTVDLTGAAPSASPASKLFFADDDDFGPDLDVSAFDSFISSSVAAAAAASTPKPAQTQSQLDEEALQALVECTQHFSDADVLAAGSEGHFGDVRATKHSRGAAAHSARMLTFLCLFACLILQSAAAAEAVEENAAAEIACRGYIIAKRGFSWTNNAQLNPKRVRAPMHVLPWHCVILRAAASLSCLFCFSLFSCSLPVASTVLCPPSCGVCRARSIVCSLNCSSIFHRTAACSTWKHS